MSTWKRNGIWLLRVREALNFHLLPHPVAVLSAEIVSEQFNARLSARRRHYVSIASSIDARRLFARRPSRVVMSASRFMHAAAMHAAAQRLLGKHDFSTFRASLCQANSPVKTLDRLDIAKQGDEIHITAMARSFLHHQVRNMVGTLKLVGEGKWSADDIAAALAACDRTKGGPTAPVSDGLYLVEVGY